jgi:hypothetical protein
MLVHFVHNSTGLKYNEIEMSEFDCGELFAYNEHAVFMQLFTVSWLAELLEARFVTHTE